MATGVVRDVVEIVVVGVTEAVVGNSDEVVDIVEDGVAEVDVEDAVLEMRTLEELTNTGWMEWRGEVIVSPAGLSVVE
jgi:hypothetical protein